MAVFYIKQSQISNGTIELKGNDVNHIKNVLRYQNGDTITLWDEQENRFLGKILNMTEDKIILDILEQNNQMKKSNVKVTLFQGLPKGDKMDLIIQKCTELGVTEIVPVITTRTIVKLEEKAIPKKVERWNKIAMEASKQCGRGVPSIVTEVVNLKNMIEKFEKYDIVILPYECEKECTLKTIFKNQDLRWENIGILIGPEGGFDEKDLALFSSEKIKRVTLGSRILRTETAGFVTLAILMYELGEI